MWQWFRTGLIMGLICGISLRSAWASGATVNIDGEEVRMLPEWAVTETAMGGKLLLSDSPEEFTETGILYSDVIEGDARLFYYHVNGMLYKKKVAVVLENTQNQPVKVILYRQGVAGPSANYLLVGKVAQQKYFNVQEPRVIEIPAKEAVLLDEIMAQAELKPHELVNGIYDFIAYGPVRLKVMAVGAFADPLQEHRQANVLAADIHRLRGTFPYADRLKLTDQVFDVVKDGPHVITLGDGNIDKFITGIDATDGSPVLNYGNYGVSYRVFMATAAGNNTTLKLNPRGGVYAGALGLKVNGKNWPVVGTPGDRTCIDSPDTATDVATLQPDADLWINFMPPGASNLPIKLILAAEKEGRIDRQGGDLGVGNREQDPKN